VNEWILSSQLSLRLWGFPTILFCTRPNLLSLYIIFLQLTAIRSNV
jgi:hypothetical protein